MPLWTISLAARLVVSVELLTLTYFTGKSSLLAALGRREVPIPEHIDIFHLTREMPASDKTALQCVMEVDEERVKLEKLAEQLAHCEDDGNYPSLCRRTRRSHL